MEKLVKESLFKKAKLSIYRNDLRQTNFAKRNKRQSKGKLK